jgi:hypothetical protein
MGGRAEHTTEVLREAGCTPEDIEACVSRRGTLNRGKHTPDAGSEGPGISR